MDVLSSKKGKFLALLPLLTFIIIYFCTSLYFNDFYKVPVLVVFMLSLFIGLLQYPKLPIKGKLSSFAKGAGDENILIMVLIFLLAGGFGQLSSDVGSIAATINFTLSYINPNWIILGLFIVSCFISTSLGTSVGTVVALAPIAVGLNDTISGSMGIALAAVVGGAMFGDNLSFISDTTIAATRTQGVRMKDKFVMNFKIVAPAAVVTCFIYFYMGRSIMDTAPYIDTLDYDLVKIIPYLLVFALAILGMNVLWTLALGIITTLVIGLWTDSIDLFAAAHSINEGFDGMFELSLLCLIIGGVVGVIRYHGGIDFLLHQVSKRINSPRKAELGISFLVAAVNTCIANNTITIIIVGPLAKEIGDNNKLEPRRVASILDTISCFVQGVLPYGAQVLAALSAAAYVIGPSEILQYLYYPFLTGIATLLFIGLKKTAR